MEIIKHPNGSLIIGEKIHVSAFVVHFHILHYAWNEIESFKGKENQRKVTWLQCVAHMGEIKMHQKFSLGNMRAFDALRDFHIYVKMELKRILRK